MDLKLCIKNVRCYKSLSITFKPGLNYVHGPNGSGKTTILECISLFAPGKSIRGASISDVISVGEKFCSVSMNVEDNVCDFASVPPEQKINLNGVRTSKSKIIEMLSISWLTPQIMFHFWKDGQVRRNLLDRLVSNFIPQHAIECAKYEKARTQRNEAMVKNADPILFNALEKIILHHGLAVINGRKRFIALVNDVLQSEFVEHRIAITLEGGIEDLNNPETIWADEMRKNRFTPSRFGPNRTNVTLEFKNMNALQCSTGEQQICIILFVLAAIKVLNQGFHVLLLDDIFANLDEGNAEFLVHALKNKIKVDYVIANHTKLIDLTECCYFSTNSEA